PPSRLIPAVELAAADLASDLAGGNDDLDFITEHLTEAEVFAKYGLAEKAAEHLRAVLERAPKNLTAHERLFRILLEEGENDAARAAAQAYVTLLEESGDRATIDAVKHEFTLRGQTFAPAAAARAAAPVAAPAPEPTISIDDFADETADEISFDLDTPSELEFELEPPADFGADTETAEPMLEVTEPEPEPVLELAREPEPEPVEELSTQELTFAEELPAAEEFAAVEELSLDDETAPATLFEPEPVESLSTEPLMDIAAEPMMELEEPLLDLGQPDLEIDEPMPTLDEPVAEEPAFAEPLLTEPMFGEPVADEPMFGGAIADEPLLAEQVADEPLLELESEPDLSFGSVAEPEPAVAASTFDEPASDPFFGTEASGFDLEDLPLEELGEVDFYIEQELFDEARRKLDALSARFPGHAELESRRERVEDAATAAAAAAVVAAAPPAPARPSLLSRDEIETELLSAIPDDDDDFALPMAPATAAPAAALAEPPAAAMTASLVQEENLFADEDNFFDLAAELESELADEDESISLSEEEQSLEEIFKEFKKGVEQQLDSEDYDTHYNLGIAYKEMGLIDEAIGEFQLASKDPKRAVECASMLGLCFLEKGMPQLAIKWYRKGLEMPEITEDEHVGLLYDLASAHQEVGDTENAQKAFMEVYGMNSNYRDIVSRIKQLEDSRR
ncbi:MAG TPA: hypothetical protein VF846_18930, partial [Thermoanaerobaculia bacterium]